MVPFATPSRRIGIALLLIAIVVVGVTHPSVNDFPGFSDHTGPTRMSVTNFERLDSGCADDVAKYAESQVGPYGKHTRTSFIETGDPDANLSVSTERTSVRGADLSTFRVAVESHGRGNASNASCVLGVQYRLTVQTSGGSPAGLVPDAYGTRILWLENGRYDGCTGSVTSPLDAECRRFRDDPQRTWANATN